MLLFIVIGSIFMWLVLGMIGVYLIYLEAEKLDPNHTIIKNSISWTESTPWLLAAFGPIILISLLCIKKEL